MSNVVVVTREEAIRQGLKRYFNGKPCPHGHLCERKVKNSTCCECHNAQGRKWAKENPEKARALGNKRYQEKRKEISDYSKENRKKILKTKPWYGLLGNAKQRAKKLSLACDIDQEWCENNWTGFCSLSNIEFDLFNSKIGIYSPSIDRIEPSKGYTKDNCRFILHSLNAFKGTSTDEEIFEIFRKLVEFQNDK